MDRELDSAVATFVRFMEHAPLAVTIANLEHALEGAERGGIAEQLPTHGVSPELLRAARYIRDQVGRVSDVIHASAIALALPHLLEPGEVLRRPSLAAGNDSSRPFDVETNRRIAEFKLAQWAGADAMRKRQLFKDFVELAADDSGRAAELYVLGQRPIHFLASTKAPATWGLDRFPATQTTFQQHFGSLDVPIGAFVASIGCRVRVIDLEKRLPDLFAGE